MKTLPRVKTQTLTSGRQGIVPEYIEGLLSSQPEVLAQIFVRAVTAGLTLRPKQLQGELLKLYDRGVIQCRLDDDGSWMFWRFPPLCATKGDTPHAQ